MKVFVLWIQLIGILYWHNSFVITKHFDHYTVDANYIGNVRQLTFGGSNSEASFSKDGRFITFQASGGDFGTNCDQIYRLELNNLGNLAHRLSTGFGECTSSSFYFDRPSLIYSGTFHQESFEDASNSCSKNVCQSSYHNNFELAILCRSSKTLYELNANFDIFKINEWGNFEEQLTHAHGFDADASVSPDGKWIVFTSMRSGDPDLWLMSTHDRTQKFQLTTSIGYEGRARFSHDSQRIIFHASVPSANAELRHYHKLLKYNLVELAQLQIFSIAVNGKNLIQLTDYRRRNLAVPATSWSPSYLSDNRHVLFSSNMHSLNPTTFHLYVIDELDPDRKAKQLTFHNNAFDAFPIIDYSGTKLLWSTSTIDKPDEMNLFLADWEPAANDITKKQANKYLRQKRKSKKFREMHFKDEKHLQNVKQITFGGMNAEGYFSFDDKSIVLQATGVERYGTACDQIYRADFTPNFPDVTTIFQRISTGLGVCTCSYFFPDKENLIYASTFAKADLRNVSNTCSPKRCASSEAKTDPVLRQLCNTSYSWDLFPDYDIYKVNKYGNIVQRLTNNSGYDAEGAVSPDGTKIVFTSLRTGDPELWIMNADGSEPRQLTNEFGYDGGPFFSPDGTKIGFRASRPKTKTEIEKYKLLLSYNLVEPLEMELYTINVDGTGVHQVTHLGGSNWAPFYLNDNLRMIFSTNFNASHFGTFDLYVVDQNGANVTQITYTPGGFDAFPMMSNNGKMLVWASSRNPQSSGDLNLFLADWIN